LENRVSSVTPTPSVAIEAGSNDCVIPFVLSPQLRRLRADSVRVPSPSLASPAAPRGRLVDVAPSQQSQHGRDRSRDCPVARAVVVDRPFTQGKYVRGAPSPKTGS
jgi:hypothetical protein